MHTPSSAGESARTASAAASISDTTVQKQPKRAAAAAFMGTAIEYYDFYIYALASALIFGQLFFKTDNAFIGTMASFATFAIGLFIRPIGGIFFGHIGDKIGRKKSLMITLFLMGISTVCIGLLPTFEQAGIIAPILLIVLRLVQGLAVGGEWGGAVLIAGEHAPTGRRAFFASFAQLGSPAGLILATLAFKLITSMPEEDFLSYGWRLPFLASFAMLIVGFLIRHGVHESPEFVEEQQKKQTQPATQVPLMELFKESKAVIGLALCANVLGVAGFYFATTFMVAYTTQFAGLDKAMILDAMLIVAILHFFNTPIAAYFGEKLGTRKFLIITSAICAITPFLMFPLVLKGSLGWVALGLWLPMWCMSSFYSLVAGFTSSLFPVHLRYSGISVAYQMCSAVAGGLTPLIATSIAQQSGGSTLALSLFFTLLCVISCVAVLRLNPKKYPTH